MATLGQVRTGMQRYIENEIVPHLDGVRRFGVSLYVALAAQSIESRAAELLKHPAVAILGIVDDDGEIDIDRLHAAAISQMHGGEKLQVDIPVVGRFAFDRNDIDRLFEEVRKA